MRYTIDMDIWLRENFYKYNRYELQGQFNVQFNTSCSVKNLIQHCNKTLNLKLGNRHQWTTEELEWVRLHVQDHTWKELAEEFNKEFGLNVTANAIKVISRKHNIQHEVELGVKFTDEQVQWLIENVPGADSWEKVTEEFNKVFNTSKRQTALRSKMRYIEDVFINQGRTGCHIGATAHNELPIGSERVLNSRYTYVKTGKKTWTPKQKVIYEKKHGPIPKDSFVIFLNNDCTDFRLENLYLVDRKIHGSMCSRGWYGSDPELTLAGIKYCELTQAMNEKPKLKGES